MAKATLPDKHKDEPKYPSLFGSHASMINEKATEELNDPTRVVLTDKYGNYATFKSRLDNNLADPLRYSSHRIVIEKVKKEQA